MTLDEHRAALKERATVLMWCDKLVEELDRDGLLLACYDFASALEGERRWNQQTIEMQELFDSTRKAITGARI